MILGSLFTIPMWTLPCLNFSKKKKQLEQLVKLILKENTAYKLLPQIGKEIEVVLLRPFQIL